MLFDTKQRQLEKNDLNNLGFREIIHCLPLEKSQRPPLFSFLFLVRKTFDQRSWLFLKKFQLKKYRWKRNQPKREWSLSKELVSRRSCLVFSQKDWLIFGSLPGGNQQPNRSIRNSVLAKPRYRNKGAAVVAFTSNVKAAIPPQWNMIRAPISLRKCRDKVVGRRDFHRFLLWWRARSCYVYSKYEHTSQGKVAQFTR